MKVRKSLLIVGVLVALVLLVAPAFAQGGEREGKVVYGKDFTLEKGEVIDGDLAVLGGNLTLEEGSEVTGDLMVLGGNAKIAGTVRGEVAVTGGQVEVKETAVIEGNLVIVGGNLDIDENAVVKGEITYPGWSGWKDEWQEWEEGIPEPPPAPPSPPVPSRAINNPLVQLIINMMQAVIWMLIAGVLAVIAVLFLPKQTKLIKNTLVEQPILAIGVGVITIFACPIAVVILAITICLPPIVVIALLLASAWGWVAIGWLIGERMLAERFDANNPLGPVVLGTILPTFVVAVIWGLNAIPVIGCMFGLLGFVVSVIGIGAGVGAVLLTKFGTTTYPWPSKSAAAPPPAAALPAPPASPATKKLPLEGGEPHGTD